MTPTLNDLINILPIDCRLFQLPITQQLLIFAETKYFTNEKRAEIVEFFSGNCELGCIKTGPTYTNILLINNYPICDDQTFDMPNSEIINQLEEYILRKYAQESIKNHRDSMLSWEIHTAYEDSYGNWEYARSLEKALKKDPPLPITVHHLIDKIAQLQSLTIAAKRQVLYEHFNVFSGFESKKINPAVIEIALRKLQNLFLAQETMQFNEKNTEKFPLDEHQKIYCEVGRARPSLLKIKAKNTSLVIKELNITIEEFNLLYGDKYLFEEKSGISTVKDIASGNICANFFSDWCGKGLIEETIYSQSQFRFIEKLNQKNEMSQLERNLKIKELTEIRFKNKEPDSIASSSSSLFHKKDRAEDYSPFIKGLNISLAEFAEKYGDKYLLAEGKGIARKNMWDVTDKETATVCGFLTSWDNGQTIEETTYSKGEYNFVRKLSSLNLTP